MKIKKNYRLHKYIVEEMEKMLKDKNVTETAFIEIAIIEKLQRMKGGK